MRETLSHNRALPNFNSVRTSSCFEQSKIIDNNNSVRSCGQFFSLELCPNRYLDAVLLSEIRPRFCSVTWHSSSDIDFKNVAEIPAIKLSKELIDGGYNVLLHLAGRNLGEKEALSILTGARNIGLRNIFALQGDPSQIKEKDDTRCRFPFASDLVKFSKRYYNSEFCIGIAGYPEKCNKISTNFNYIDNLRNKILLGGEFIITQASYDYESFCEFAKSCRLAGVNAPIITGVFIFSSFNSLMAMSNFCNVPITEALLNTVTNIKNNPETVKEFGVYYSTELIRKILNNNCNLFSGVHIFSLNNLELCKDVLMRLGLYGWSIERPLKKIIN